MLLTLDMDQYLDVTILVECDLDWSWVRGYPESMFLILEPDLYWDKIDVVGYSYEHLGFV